MPPSTAASTGSNDKIWIAGILGCGCFMILLVSALITGIAYLMLFSKPASDESAEKTEYSYTPVEADLSSIEIPASFWKREALAETQKKDDAAREHLTMEVQTLLRSENFGALEDRADAIRIRNNRRFYSGGFVLDRYYQALFETQEDQEGKAGSDALYARLTRWHKAFPKSVTPNVAVMRMARENAWAWRGRGYSNKVSNKNMRMFKEGLEYTEYFIREGKTFDHKDPAFYYESLIIGRGLNYGRKKERAFVEGCRDADPMYFPCYSAYAIYLLPRWHGESGDDPVRFADEASKWVEAVNPSAADEAYAYVVLRVATYGGMKYDTFFSEYPFSWPRIQQGFVDWDKRHRLNRYYMNAFCWLAVAAGDKKTAKKLFGVIGDMRDGEVWSEKSFHPAREWALAP